MNKLSPAEKKIIKAKVDLQVEAPFYSYLVHHAKYKTRKDLPKDFVAGITPNGNCYYSPDKFEELSSDKVKGVIVHEVTHLALEHHKRTKVPGITKKILNLAQDVVVNGMLARQFKLPKEGVLPDSDGNVTLQLGPDKELVIEDAGEQLAEKVALRIMDALDDEDKPPGGFDEHPDGDEENNENGNGSNENQENNEEDSEEEDQDGKSNKDQENEKQDEQSSESNQGVDGDKEDKHQPATKQQASAQAKQQEKEEETDWKRIMAEAAQMAEQQDWGNAPAGLERRVEQLLGEKVSWRDVLRRYLIKRIPNDFTWNTPSRRSRSAGVFLPAIKKSEKLECVVSIDASGSIDDDQLAKFKGTIVEIAKSFDAVDMTVITHDAKVQDEWKVENGYLKPIENWHPHGGGGTNLTKPFEWVKKNKPMTNVLVLLTDGFGPMPDNPKVEHLWVLSRNHVDVNKIKTGQVLEMGVDQQ